MKSLKIAASHAVASLLSTSRDVVTLDSTDFTDVAAVVLSVPDTRSGILALLARTGFNLPVFVYLQEGETCALPVSGTLTGSAQGVSGARNRSAGL